MLAGVHCLSKNLYKGDAFFLFKQEVITYPGIVSVIPFLCSSAIPPEMREVLKYIIFVF